MSSHKINFGIDLGTTNSAIARMRNGEASITKLERSRDTMASCVSLNSKGTLFVGDIAYNEQRKQVLNALRDWKESKNVFSQFKRLMGEDVLFSFGDKTINPEGLSAEVLKKIRSFITDVELRSIVITIPTKFERAQRDATIAAARLAGFDQCELLEEPIAASLAFGLGKQDLNGTWMVFDFGGGTFDAALLKVEEGIMKVLDTEGDNHLGGKNLDEAVVQKIIVPYLEGNFSLDSVKEDKKKLNLLRKAMTQFAEGANIALSFSESHEIQTDLGDIPLEDDDGNEVELDIQLDRSDLAVAVAPVFQKAIELGKELLDRNGITGSQLNKLILVGGPTYSPILRNMLSDKITSELDTSIDPMTAIATGAALYASTIDISKEIVSETRDSEKLQLDLGYPADSVEVSEHVTIKIARGPEEETNAKYFAEFERVDKAWSSGRIQFDDKGEIVEVTLKEGIPNVFDILVFDDQGIRIDCEPSQITILQGIKVANATLPYNIGIGIKSGRDEREVFHHISGLDKNKTLPVIGIRNGLKTQQKIRPGVATDVVRLPLYEGEDKADGTSVIHSSRFYDLTLLTGDDIVATLPENSDVDLTVKFSGNGEVSVSAYFPSIDFTKEVKVPAETRKEEIVADWLTTELEKARQSAGFLSGSENADSKAGKILGELDELKELMSTGRNDRDRKRQVLNGLRKQFRKLEKLRDSAEWPNTERELKEVFYDLEELFKESEHLLDDSKGSRFRHLVSEFRSNIPKVIKNKEVKLGREMIDSLRSVHFALLDIVMGVQLEIQLLKQFHEDFDIHDWKDNSKARLLIDQGFRMIAGNPDKQQMRMLLREVYGLLPETDQNLISEKDRELLTD